MTEHDPANNKPDNGRGQNEDLDNHVGDQLGAWLRAEVPEPGVDYWNSIDATLGRLQPHPAAIAPASSLTSAEATAASNAPDRSDTDISVGGVSGGGVDGAAAAVSTVTSITDRRVAAWPLAAAAALLLIAGFFVGNRLLSADSESVDAGLADEPTESTNDPTESSSYEPPAIELRGPVQNRDHWHAVYGVWDCTAADGAGDWLPKFESNRDDLGIHSHNDGLIHIHPFFESSAGKNAKLGLFADSMGITIGDDELVLDNGRVLREGEPCAGGPAVVHLRRWVLDAQVLAEPTTPPTVVTDNLADERFYNDREVWTIAYAPLDADIPLPPQERFDLLIQVTPAIEYSPGELDDVRPGLGVDQTPPTDLQLLPGILGAGYPPVVEVPQADRYIPITPGRLLPQDQPRMELGDFNGVEPQAVEYFWVELGPARQLDLYRFESQGSRCVTAPTFFAQICSDTAPAIGRGVSVSSSSEVSSFVVHPAVPDGGLWMLVELDTGETIAANAVDNLSFAEWSGSGGFTTVRILDVDLNEIESQVFDAP